jgi:hypothetical protein
MRWFKRIALTLVAIVVLLLGIGLILPSTFKVQRSIDILEGTGMTSISAVPHQRADHALCFPSLAKIAVNRAGADVASVGNLKALAERSST